MKSVRGSVLSLVLVVLLVLFILLTSMIRLPGPLRRTVALVASETQEMYLAESAVLAKLEGYPEGYFANLPNVERYILGPWIEWRTRLSGHANEFRFLLGNEFGRFAAVEKWSHVGE